MKITPSNTKTQIQSTPLNPQIALDFVYTPSAGAIDIFIGTTRQWTADKETTTLHYDCYEPMALAEMEALALKARKQWPIKKVCIMHRINEVPVGESSVIIAVSSPHRADAFDACRFLIDTLKESVPIWKREYYADGTTEWAEPDVKGRSVGG